MITFVCLVWLSEQTLTFVSYIINRLVFITEIEGVYGAIRAECLYKTHSSHSLTHSHTNFLAN
jgi:hypothetical protein